MDRNLFLAVTLCAGIYLAWYNYTSKNFPQPQAPQAGQVSTAATPATTEPTKLNAEKQKPASELKEQMVSLGKGAFNVTLSTRGGVIKSVEMGTFRNRPTDNLKTLIGGSQQLELSIPSGDWSYVSDVVYKLAKEGKNPNGLDEVILNYDDERISIQRTYALNPDLYSVDHDIVVHFKKMPQPNFVFVGLKTLGKVEKLENEKREVYFNRTKGGVKIWADADIKEMKEELTEGRWAAFSSRYFLNAIIDRGSVMQPYFQARPVDSGEITGNLVYRVPGPSLAIPTRYYFGPKDIDTLKTVAPTLDTAVDFGWFTIFAFPMLKALKIFYGFLKNYGLAIILLTIIVKLLTYPLTLKSMKSMKAMQKVQPQMQKLREKYADDKEKLNREMMSLMKTTGYNPVSGCLPMLIQMPVFIALYNVLFGAIDLYGMPFFGWITDLSVKDPFYVTPVLLALLMFLQQKLTPNTATDPAQQKMMMMMPLIFGFMMLWLPSGLTLYMLINSVTSIIQQVIINKQLGINTSLPAA